MRVYHLPADGTVKVSAKDTSTRPRNRVLAIMSTGFAASFSSCLALLESPPRSMMSSTTLDSHLPPYGSAWCVGASVPKADEVLVLIHESIDMQGVEVHVWVLEG